MCGAIEDVVVSGVVGLIIGFAMLIFVKYIFPDTDTKKWTYHALFFFIFGVLFYIFIRYT